MTSSILRMTVTCSIVGIDDNLKSMVQGQVFHAEYFAQDNTVHPSLPDIGVQFGMCAAHSEI